MKRLTDKYKIDLTLRMYRSNNLTLEKATTDILKFYSNSMRFNTTNFIRGIIIGAAIASMVIKYVL